jgi:hypothetical protein
VKSVFQKTISTSTRPGCYTVLPPSNLPKRKDLLRSFNLYKEYYMSTPTEPTKKLIHTTPGTFETKPEPIDAFIWTGEHTYIPELISWVNSRREEMCVLFKYKDGHLHASIGKLGIHDSHEIHIPGFIGPGGGFTYNPDYERFEAFPKNRFEERYRPTSEPTTPCPTCNDTGKVYVGDNDHEPEISGDIPCPTCRKGEK